MFFNLCFYEDIKEQVFDFHKTINNIVFEISLKR